MHPDRIRRLLLRLRAGDVAVEEVLEALSRLPFEDIGDARIDHHRMLRRGVPEIIYGEGKSAEQIVRIAERMQAAGTPMIATRLSADTLEAVAAALPAARVDRRARLAICGPCPSPRESGVLVCCAGTTDLPVADEATLTLEVLGHRVSRRSDIGVAGLHRILAGHAELQAASVIVAVAGMEGALPSVIAGLVACPVIGVPTSVGYGASFGGVSALLAMLNSCAGGLLVVNIDNGVGAALAADAIVRTRSRQKSTAGECSNS
ncbi:MAG: nickel pincer cofactor biosynthesis protein LarB [Acidobacteriota bacterium]